MQTVKVSRETISTIVFVGLLALVLLAVLTVTGVVTSPFGRAHVKRAQVWFQRQRQSTKEYDTCDCMWRIGCPEFSWQVNFTSPKFNCGFEAMTNTLISECMTSRAEWYGNDLKLHVVGHWREAFMVDYLRRRIQANVVQSDCQVYQAKSGKKDFDVEKVDVSMVTTKAHAPTCSMKFARDGLELDFMYFDLMGPEVFSYVENLLTQCKAQGCKGDLFIISGGMGELLNSTLFDSFRGVRRFQHQFQKMLPLLIQLKTQHGMDVVWKIHEPVTDELIPDDSMVRNDLFQEYNALIMEQALSTPITVWTSHMLMKLNHIEKCTTMLNAPNLNEENWRCEEELVAGDLAHAEYFEAIFNFICEKQVQMPQNPCCSA